MMKTTEPAGRQFFSAFEIIEDAVIVLNEAGRLLYMNGAAERLYGLKRATARGRALEELFVVETSARSFPEILRRVEWEGDWRGAARLTTGDGRRLALDWLLRRIECPEFAPFAILLVARDAAARDITRQRDNERKLRAVEEEWERTFDAVPDMIAILDKNYRIIRANRAFAKLLGKRPKELEGEFCYNCVHCADAPIKDCPHAKTMQDGGVHIIECWEKRLNVEMISTTSPLYDAEGELVGTVHISRDVTAQKKAEQERHKAEEQLRQAQKMESIGRLAGGVAHDFNNLLTSIAGNVELAMMDLDPNHPLFQNMIEVKKAAESAAHLTRQLLVFSRKQLVEPKVLNLNEVIEHIQKMLRRLIGEDVELKTILSDKLGAVKIDHGQVEQIIVNLAVNARDAMPNGGKLTLQTANAILGEEYHRQHPHAPPGAYVLLAISDNGSGMSPEVKAHLFEPFFTTKEQDKGTGLGLATVYGAVKQGGGHIEVYSETGLGTTFKIYLPRIDAATEMVDKTAAEEMPKGTETVFLVEDEEIVKDLAVKVLQRQGYQVSAYRNGGEALKDIEGYDGPIHLLVTDVIMPGFNGRVLAEKVGVLRPETRILFSSGYTEEVIVHHGVLDDGIEFLAKPYSPHLLARRVREVLDKG
ncbi:MAG: PAS domain-containing sensor histidine kinase [Myxococcales bacterium]|nr:MAG: PAS domain-containing sensor histidine kinase [Myxococcales bacterium]